jgi:hypothetical protein
MAQAGGAAAVAGSMHLETENSRLRRAVSDLTLDKLIRSTPRKIPQGRDEEKRLTADTVELARQYGRYGQNLDQVRRFDSEPTPQCERYRSVD